MKRVFILTAFLFVAHITAATEIQQKAQNLATQYQTAAGLDATATQAAADLLQQYFTDLDNGNPIDPGVQSQVDNILAAISAGVVPAATTLHFKITGALLTTDPVWNSRVYNTSYDPANLCRTQGSITARNIYYQVHPFFVLQQGDVEIEDVVVPTTYDSYFVLYCAFNPLQPLNNLILHNDDGGSGWRAKLTLPGLPVGKYYLVVTSFSNGQNGPYDIEFRSDNGVLAQEMPPVPLKSWPVVVVFLLIGVAFIVIRRYVI